MIWLSYRQLRTQAAIVFTATGLLVLVLLASGRNVWHLARTDIEFLSDLQFHRFNTFMYVFAAMVMYALPAVIGAFWGAPLVAKELEANTHRLIWNQSTTRQRWLAAKLAVTVGCALLVTGALSWVLSWWSGPIDASVAHGHGTGPFSLPRLNPVLFGARGVVPLGYTLLAVTLGVVVGLLLRRSVPAIGLTVVLMIAVQLVMPLAVRSHLIGHAVKTMPISQSKINGIRGSGPSIGGPDTITGISYNQSFAPGAWAVSDSTLNADGRALTSFPTWIVDCLGKPPMPGVAKPSSDIEEAQSAACYQRLAGLGYQHRLTFVPESRFWALQWRETGLLAVLSLLLVAASFALIRRDLS